MNQLKQLFSSLSTPQRITIAAVAVLVLGGLWGFAKWAKERDFRPLYTGMTAEDAGAVVQKLKESGADYRLAENGGSVLVPSAKLAELRLAMAGAGLPKSGRIGFELFDKNNFGATEFVEHINYRRALEGELERSVMSLAEVEQARVHITFPKESIYLDAQQPAKASVMMRLRPGTRLAANNLLAVAHLVSSAVEGLAPEFVAVLDMQGNLLSRPKRLAEEGMAATGEAIETRQRIERDLVAKINHTLEPLLGPEKFRAGASVECDFSSGEQSEETFDPSKSVMVTSQKTEDTTSGAASPFGVPGTASNLPNPPAQGVVHPAGGTSRRTENIAYQTSRMTRRTRLMQGSIKRLSVSVLLDHQVRWAGGKRNLVPPPPETVKAIRDLVAGVAGIVPDRGDQLIVESLPFESTLNVEPPPSGPAVPSGAQRGNPLQEALKSRHVLVGVGVACVLSLLLLFGAVMRRSRKKAPVPATEVPRVLEAAGEETPNLARKERLAAQVGSEADELPLPALPSAPVEPQLPESTASFVDRIREAIKTNAEAPAHLIRTWVNEAQP
jgi:flagellar M-ring protein FliF